VILSIAVRLIASGLDRAIGMPFIRADLGCNDLPGFTASAGANIYLESTGWEGLQSSVWALAVKTRRRLFFFRTTEGQTEAPHVVAALELV
jgi:hypothetical protein